MVKKRTIKEVDVRGKRVLVRVDYNVPLDENLNITDDSRIVRSLPTIKYLVDNGAKVILMSHLGRPKGRPEDKYRLDPVAKRLGELLGVKVKKFNEVYSEEVKAEVMALKDGEVAMLENLRFDPGEEKNDEEFARKLASLGEIYVNDAFGAAHRAHASVEAVARMLPAYAGFLMEAEINALYSLLEAPARPFVAILGGSKVSDKLKVIQNLLDKVDALLIGGGMCFTFLKSKGYEVGSSICEDDHIPYCREVMQKAEQKGVSILLPVDVVIANAYQSEAASEVVRAEAMRPGWMGLDIGPETVRLFSERIKGAKTVFWNGPMGVFEWDKFEKGTREIAVAVASSSATTVIGGGDTVAAVSKYGVQDRITHVSTGGGASLELLEGKKLPGIEVIPDAA